MFSEERGFGFIKPDEGSVHVSALKVGDDIKVGTAVSFETGTDPKSGKIKAVSVDLVYLR